MFNVQEKHDIADGIQKLLKATNHPELPKGEIHFTIHVFGEESWSLATIRNNRSVANPIVNPWNEQQARSQT